MSRALRYWAAIAPSFLAVAAIAVRAEWSLTGGVEVRLEVRPYDPMDALSGRYLAVPLAIESLGAEVPRDLEEYRPGETVWVRLAAGDPCWRPVAVGAVPALGSEVALRGRVQYQAAGQLRIDYELDRFYIPHQGADPTTPWGKHLLIAVVRIARDGHPMLADLLVDGEPYASWNARQAR